MSQSTEIDRSLKKLYEETHIEWEVTDFFLKYKKGLRQSPPFSFTHAAWHLKLYPESWYDSGFMAFTLYNKVLREYSVEYNFGLKKLDGSSEQLVTDSLDGQEKFTYHSLIKLSEVLQRKREFSRSDELTITCTLKRGTILSIQSSVLDKQKLKKLIKLDTLSENFKDLFLNKESCDTTLCVGNNEYKAHKAVLIARSSVFSAMFLHEMSEKQTGIITIPDCDPGSFEEFLEYLYCGKLEELSFHSALHLYETSDKYDVQELKTFCTEFLMENLTPENLLEVVNMADKYDDLELFSAAQNFFNNNLNSIFQTSEWESLLKNNYPMANKLLKEMSKIKAIR